MSCCRSRNCVAVRAPDARPASSACATSGLLGLAARRRGPTRSSRTRSTSTDSVVGELERAAGEVVLRGRRARASGCRRRRTGPRAAATGGRRPQRRLHRDARREARSARRGAARGRVSPRSVADVRVVARSGGAACWSTRRTARSGRRGRRAACRRAAPSPPRRRRRPSAIVGLPGVRVDLAGGGLAEDVDVALARRRADGAVALRDSRSSPAASTPTLRSQVRRAPGPRQLARRPKTSESFMRSVGVEPYRFTRRRRVRAERGHDHDDGRRPACASGSGGRRG